jgi:protein TonB
MRTVAWVLVIAMGVMGCRRADEDARGQLSQLGADRRDQPPISINADPPVQYPPDLFAERVEGTVVLRLFVDSTGAVVPDSTRIRESSGHAGLDSAALGAVPALRFAPALRNGVPASSAFDQPIIFQQPGTGETAP